MTSARTNNKISLLEHKVQTKIRSAVQITDLNQVVLELVKNALDANASWLRININYKTGFAGILDDGCGILEDDLDKIGVPFCTSKHGRLDTYGQNGRFLAALAGVCLLHVAHKCNSDLVKAVWRDDTGIISSDSITEDVRDGWVTKVSCRNLFAKFPVRHRYLVDTFSNESNVRREYEKLGRSLTALLLANLSRSIDLSLTCESLKQDIRVKTSGELPLDASKICSPLIQAGLLGRSQRQSWQQSIITSQRIKLKAFISLEPAPHKYIQFISLNHFTLDSSIHKDIFHIISSIFTQSSFGCQKSLRGEYTKDIERWPMFVVVGSLDSSKTLSSVANNDLLDARAEKLQACIVSMLETLFQEFLTSNDFHLQIRPQQSLDIGTKKGQYDPTASFQHFRRIKSSHPSVGCPSSNMQIHEKIASAPATTVTEGEPNPSTAEFDPEHKDVDVVTEENANIPWLNPRTGQVAHIDSRTGMLIKSVQSQPFSSIDNLIPANTSVRRKKLLKPNPTISQVAQNISQMREKRFLTQRTEPIRSISLIDPTQDLHEQTCSHASAMDIFWSSLASSSTTVPRPMRRNIARTLLRKAKILGQVSQKFILAQSDDLLILIDQHAADERCKVELLRHSLYTDPSITLNPTLVFELPIPEVQALSQMHEYFGQWHIEYTIASELPDRISITGLPPAIAERCRLEPSLIVNLLREEIWSDNHRAHIQKLTPQAHIPNADRSTEKGTTAHLLTSLPKRLQDLINSRACRSAIMFNDTLSLQQCEKLVRDVSECMLPFVCAHGRRSMVVCADLKGTSIADALADEVVDTGADADTEIRSQYWQAGGSDDVSARSKARGLNEISDVSFREKMAEWTGE